ncbi:hypothetical protein BSL78_06052 [Apostichopus japonicus]|uniref:Uncharacterized protein n=1 Tax=Stichopus japonicus TaxID=307972 RepID=A0A2G8L9X1_STIJA|nr:hypothetical protein BSL78_06052 [Apostichopus japonicus]
MDCSLKDLKSCVLWLPNGWQERGYKLNIHSGRWQNRDSDEELSDKGYQEELALFRQRYRSANVY